MQTGHGTLTFPESLVFILDYICILREFWWDFSLILSCLFWPLQWLGFHYNNIILTWTTKVWYTCRWQITRYDNASIIEKEPRGIKGEKSRNNTTSSVKTGLNDWSICKSPNHQNFTKDVYVRSHFLEKRKLATLQTILHTWAYTSTVWKQETFLLNLGSVSVFAWCDMRKETTWKLRYNAQELLYLNIINFFTCNFYLTSVMNFM